MFFLTSSLCCVYYYDCCVCGEREMFLDWLRRRILLTLSLARITVAFSFINLIYIRSHYAMLLIISKWVWTFFFSSREQQQWFLFFESKYTQLLIELLSVWITHSPREFFASRCAMMLLDVIWLREFRRINKIQLISGQPLLLIYCNLNFFEVFAGILLHNQNSYL